MAIMAILSVYSVLNCYTGQWYKQTQTVTNKSPTNIRNDYYSCCHQITFSNMIWIFSVKNHFHQKVLGHPELLVMKLWWQKMMWWRKESLKTKRQFHIEGGPWLRTTKEPVWLSTLYTYPHTSRRCETKSLENYIIPPSLESENSL